MAITVATDMTTISDCESSTGWTGPTAALDGDVKKQGSNSISWIVRNNGQQIYYTVSDVDYSGKHMRFWVTTGTFGQMQTKALGGLRFFMYDGANTAYWNIAGSDTYTGGWINICVYADSAPDSGSCTISSVNRIGIEFGLTSSYKRVVNTWVDYLRFGDYLAATDTVQFGIEEVYQDDLANGYGIIEKDEGVYFLSGGLYFGSTGTASADTYVDNEVVVFKENPVYSTYNGGLHRIDGIGNSTGSTDVTIANSVLTTASQNLSASDYTGRWHMEFNDTNVDNLLVTGCVINAAHYAEFQDGQIIENTTISNGSLTKGNGALFNGCTITKSFIAGLHIIDSTEQNDYSNCSFKENNFWGSTVSDVRIENAGSYYWYNNIHDGLALYDIDLAVGNTDTTIYLTGNSYVDPSNVDSGVTVINAKEVSISIESETGTALTGYEWRLYLDSATAGVIGTSQLAGEESATSSTQQYLYNYSSDTDVVLQVIADDYEESLTYFTLGNADQDVNVTMLVERNI